MHRRIRTKNQWPQGCFSQTLIRKVHKNTISNSAFDDLTMLTQNQGAPKLKMFLQELVEEMDDVRGTLLFRSTPIKLNFGEHNELVPILVRNGNASWCGIQFQNSRMAVSARIPNKICCEELSSWTKSCFRVHPQGKWGRWGQERARGNAC